MPTELDVGRIGRGRGADYRLARVVAYLFNPLIFPPVLLAYASAATRGSWKGAGLYGGLFFFLLPVLFALVLVAKGRLPSIEMQARGSRALPMLFTAACAAAAAALVRPVLPAEGALLGAICATYAVGLLLARRVNKRTKVSLHLLSASGFASMSTFVALDLGVAGRDWTGFLAGIAAFAMLPLLGWARLRTGAHTPGEVLLGILSGLLFPPAMLYILQSAGLF